MPIKIRKVRNQDCYRVFNAETGEVYAKCSTRTNALEQKKLLDDADKMKKDLNMTDKEIDEEVKKVVKETKGKVVIHEAPKTSPKSKKTKSVSPKQKRK